MALLPAVTLTVTAVTTSLPAEVARVKWSRSYRAVLEPEGAQAFVPAVASMPELSPRMVKGFWKSKAKAGARVVASEVLSAAPPSASVQSSGAPCSPAETQAGLTMMRFAHSAPPLSAKTTMARSKLLGSVTAWNQAFAPEPGLGQATGAVAVPE